MARELYGGEREPMIGQLRELDAEAYRRAEWLPSGDKHPVTIAGPEIWQHRSQYGLCWHSSVQTILARTAAGWVVRIVGQHAQRRAAAEVSLGAQ